MKAARSGPKRRMAAPGSDNWHAMLDAAEGILREEGHAALTSRAVAERTGVKQRLVYYYFHTMEDLIVAMFRRLSERELSRLRRASEAELPLRKLWDICIHTTDARLISEFMALASRIEDLKREVIKFIEQSRGIQVAALSAAMKRTTKSSIPASGLAILATSLALTLTREGQLGIRSGHKEIMAVIRKFLSTFEPD
jgi:AcrR family transcriptional regulator